MTLANQAGKLLKLFAVQRCFNDNSRKVFAQSLKRLPNGDRRCRQLMFETLLEAPPGWQAFLIHSLAMAHAAAFATGGTAVTAFRAAR